MTRRYYLVKNLRTGEESIQLKQDFNINYSWHRPDELKSIKEILQGFKNKTHKIMKVY
jgi:hypothetical protein